MQKPLEEYGIEHGQSSPYYPRSNGHAERNVQLIKDLLIKTGNDLESEEYIDGLAQIRNTPRADGFSPNQVVFGRSVRTLVPSLFEVLGINEYIESSRKKKTENDLKEVEDFLHRIKECMPGRQYFFNFFQSSQKSSEFTG